MDLSLSYQPNYFDLEELIATQIRVPCETRQALQGFGFLDPSVSSEVLPSGAELELPLWVVPQVHQSQKWATAKPPRTYTERYRNILKADPTVVDLNKLGPHFYQSGLHVAKLNFGSNDSEEITKLLPDVLVGRLTRVAESCAFATKAKMSEELNFSTNNNNTFIKECHMDSLEHRIYKDAQVGAAKWSDWLERRD